ncbi:MAG: hypothetical protein AAGL89_19195, partial [Pseudomonadota bacterium]
THLQRMMHLNREMMAADGIRYFGPGDLRRPGRSLGEMFDLSWNDRRPSTRTPEAQLRYLTKDGNRLVFSEENFVGIAVNRHGKMNMPLYPRAAERIEELAAKWTPIKPHIFLGIRNPAAYMASVYSQALYGHNFIGPRTFRARNDWRKVDWADYVARLRATPGVGDITVWRQEDYADNMRMIFRGLLKWKTGGAVQLSKEKLHTGLSANAVRQTLEWAQQGREGDIAKEARRRFPPSGTNPPFALYAPATLDQAQQVYDAQLAQIEAMEGVTLIGWPQRDQEVGKEA